MLGKVQDREEEFIKYSQKHSLEATAKHFNIGLNYAKRLRKNLCGISIPVKTKAPDKKEFIEYAKTHTYDQCAEYFKISKRSVYLYRQKYGVHIYRNKDQDYFVNNHNIKTEFPEFAKDHTLRECAEYFKVSVSTIRTWCSKYKVTVKPRAKTLSAVALKLYILHKDDDIRYFTNLQDVAFFSGYTYPYTITLVNRDREINGYKVQIADITSYRNYKQKGKTK